MKAKSKNEILKEIESQKQEKLDPQYITGDSFEAWLKEKKKDSYIKINKYSNNKIY